MNQPKPILTIKQKCRECCGSGYHESYNQITHCDCQDGMQETEIYVLRDFEKGCVHRKKKLIRKQDECHYCDGYEIPKEYGYYEIKKVSEIGFHTLKREDAF